MRLRLKPVGQQTIVITGSSSGSGLATARVAVERGARVVLAARNRDALEQVAADLQRRGGQVAVCAADVSHKEGVEQIARVAIERFGGFDSWVNDAAAATYGRMDQVTLEDHCRIFDVNYHGLLMGSLVALRYLRQRGGIPNMPAITWPSRRACRPSSMTRRSLLTPSSLPARTRAATCTSAGAAI